MFNSVSTVSTYIKTFTFGEERLEVQIKAIENCKSKIALKTTAFATLATRFLEDGSWKESKWTKEQFLDLIEPLLALKTTISEMRDRNTIALKTIADNWGPAAAKQIKAEVHGTSCLRQIASVSVLYKDRYGEARQKLNFWIISRILSNNELCYCGVISEFNNMTTSRTYQQPLLNRSE